LQFAISELPVGPRWQSACRSDADQLTVVGQVHWSTAVETFVDDGGDLERDTLVNWQPVE